MVGKKPSARKPMKSLAVGKLTSRQAKRVQGGGLPPPTNTLSSPLITDVGLPANGADSKDPNEMSIQFTNQWVKTKF
jgi:hypothetical protein